MSPKNQTLPKVISHFSLPRSLGDVEQDAPSLRLIQQWEGGRLAQEQKEMSIPKMLTKQNNQSQSTQNHKGKLKNESLLMFPKKDSAMVHRSQLLHTAAEATVRHDAFC